MPMNTPASRKTYSSPTFSVVSAGAAGATVGAAAGGEDGAPAGAAAAPAAGAGAAGLAAGAQASASRSTASSAAPALIGPTLRRCWIARCWLLPTPRTSSLMIEPAVGRALDERRVEHLAQVELAHALVRGAQDGLRLAELLGLREGQARDHAVHVEVVGPAHRPVVRRLEVLLHHADGEVLVAPGAGDPFHDRVHVALGDVRVGADVRALTDFGLGGGGQVQRRHVDQDGEALVLQQQALGRAAHACLNGAVDQ